MANVACSPAREIAAPYGQLPRAAQQFLTPIPCPWPARRLEARSQPLDSKSQSETAAGAGTRRPLLPPESGSGSDARDRWGQSWCRWGGEKLPLPPLPGAAEVKAEAGLGWGWDSPGGAGLGLPAEAVPGRDFMPLTGGTPPLLRFHGDGYPAPLLCFHGDPDPAPLRPARSPQPALGFFYVSPGLGVLSRSGSFCQSFRGARFALLGHTHTSWSCLLRKVGLRVAAEGAGAAHRELSVFLSLLSDTEKRAFLGLRKQRFGLVPLRLDPLTCVL